MTAVFTPSRRSALALSAGAALLLAAVAPALGQSWRSDGAVAGFTAGAGFTGLTFRCAGAGRVTVRFSGFPGRLQAGQAHTVVATVDDTAFVLDTIARDAGSGSILVAEGTLAARAGFIEALRKGRSVEVAGPAGRYGLPLTGSGDALAAFTTGCS
ncbi:hypothetical protein H9Q09_03425 [Aurantimonas sp. DM33-3]|uniref:hypothetical protein n=1 Tax=Aurantimonas sp. DM33-3 TaxID=2766955 RepID=UPI001652A5CB|nr:hypothetical protein [Aurantimonas sp. DM33-3]MBC6715239.1 hypothetical protein [Aurantimonas sp. DM33-3]